MIIASIIIIISTVMNGVSTEALLIIAATYIDTVVLPCLLQPSSGKCYLYTPVPYSIFHHLHGADKAARQTLFLLYHLNVGFLSSSYV